MVLLFEVLDHFGLDKNDALTYQNGGIAGSPGAGFAAWWVLQNCEDYRPFKTLTRNIVTIKGDITP